MVAGGGGGGGSVYLARGFPLLVSTWACRWGVGLGVSGKGGGGGAEPCIPMGIQDKWSKYLL